MDDAVLKLVDDVLANAPAALREACSCRGILAGLETAGAFDVRTLRTLLEQDYAEVKQSISGAALPAFVARLKEAVLLLPASAVPATPGLLFQLQLRDVFVDASPSGCCFGKLCKFGAEAAASLAECGSCGSKMHRLCAAENAWLKWLDPESTAVACFECRLLEALLDGTALPAQLAVYYRQQVDWNRVGTANVPPFTIGAILATNALLLQQVCKTSQRARLAPPTGKCKKCKQVGALVGCSFCTAVYHNSDACLGEAKMALEALVKSPTFPWACPACFKKGVAAIQRAVLKPTGQRAAGAKRKCGKPKAKRK